MRRLIFILLFICVLGETHSFAAVSEIRRARVKISEEEMIEQTESLVRQEKWSEAEEKLGIYLRENALEEAFLPKINSLRKQIALEIAKAAARKKNWELAQKEFEIVLEIEPDNVKVARRLKEIEQFRRELEEFKTRVSNQTLQTDVRKKWSEDMGDTAAPDVQYPIVECVPMTRKNDFDIQQKLNFIFLPKVDFKDARIEDVAVFLTTRSREFDPNKSGVAFLVQDEARRQAKKISVSLRDMPLYEILKYVSQLADVKYRIENQAVFIEPMKTSTQALATREFSVRQQFVIPQMELMCLDDDYNNLPAQATKVVAEKLDAETVKKVLEKRGIVFQDPKDEISLPDGTTRKPRADEYPFAMYSPSTGILTVRNTQEQIDFLEQLILSDSADQGRSKLIKVETRVLEINQTDLDELGVNWSLNGGMLPIGAFSLPGGQSGTHIKLSGAAGETNLEGANDLPQSNLDNFIGNNQGISENTLAIQGLLDGVTFQAVLNALSQKKSANLVSAPTILVNSGGGNAVIEVVREFIYPTAFDPPQVKLYRKDRYGGDEAILERVIVPSWPSEFKTPGRKVGVSIRVTKAQADHENKNVSLELKPKITDFDGFIDYGAPILSVDNHIRVPIFTVRAFDEGFKLNIKDGYTMVLGGLIREDVQTIDDKVPVLGDIPLLGYLFRKKTERAIRKNLILFVTPRILQPNGAPINP